MSQTGFADLVEEDEEPSESVTLYVTDVVYTDGDGKPVIHLFGRDEDSERWHIESSGHRPSFYVRADELEPSVTNHYAVYDIERGYEDLHGNELVRIFTYLPKQVKDMRQHFDKHFEADVFYHTRWLIDNDIYTGVEVDLSNAGGVGYSSTEDENHVRVSVDDVAPAEPPEQDPRVIIADIEVAAEKGMPDESEANWPVSTIVAYDSYDDEYVGWVLEYEGWDFDGQDVPEEFNDPAWFHTEEGFEAVKTFDDESEMLDDFNSYIAERKPDMLSGWYSNDFDYPYLINRCRKRDVWSFKNWSPIGDVYTTNYGPVAKGVVMFDMLQGYDKTMRGEYSGKLEDVAQNEIGVGKDVVEGDHTEMWKHDPVGFLEYNKKDVRLVKEIERKKGIIKLFKQIREITGALFDDCHAPIDSLDVYFLRKAQDWGMRLPTAEEPDTSWFYGAEVLESQPGLHENVIYFDLASLYPNLIKQLNVGPETIIGFEDEVPDDVDTVHSYVDTRPVDVKKETDPETEKFYFKSPDDQESFIRQATDDVIELKIPYKGTDMYVAVKMSVNAIWGVLGDGDSYSKGFRLFDWRMGESITLAGRKVLLFTKDRAIEKFEERGYDAYATHGDTDGAGVAVEGVDVDDTSSDGSTTPASSRPDQEHLVEVAHEIAEEINEEYGPFLEDEFNSSENFMEVEVESLIDRLFIPHGATTKRPKKRRAQNEAWNDSDGWDARDEEAEIVGLEYVRADTSEATSKAQRKFVDDVLSKPLGEAKESFYEWLSAYVDEIRAGDIPLSELGRPKGVGQPLEEYGSPSDTPMPTYKGAKYANEFIYEGDKIGEGDKPMLFYVDSVDGEWPVRYPREWDTKEAGTRVDAITLDDADDMPPEISVDREKMIEKVLRRPLGRMMTPIGWDFDEALSDTEQGDITDFM